MLDMGPEKIDHKSISRLSADYCDEPFFLCQYPVKNVKCIIFGLLRNRIQLLYQIIIDFLQFGEAFSVSG